MKYANGRLAMRVLESGLDAPLKFTATVLALHANDEGYKIFPSIDRVAWLMGVSARAVQKNLSRLRALGVLIPLTPLTGGRRRVVHYQLQLPLQFDRPSWQEKLRTTLHRLGNHEPQFTLSNQRVNSSTETTNCGTERVNSSSQKGELQFTRSVQDLPEEKKEEERSAELPNGTQAPRRAFIEKLRATHPELAKSFERMKTAG